MATIIKHAERKERITYCRSFVYTADPGAGFSFDCDKEGNLLNPTGVHLETFNKCLSGEYDVIDTGIVEYRSTYTELAVLLCDCGEQFEVYDPFYCECPKCLTPYNGMGQQLRPMNEWGEETGESLADIFQDYSSPFSGDW